MIETPITYTSEDNQIVGMLHTPDKTTETVIVMCHGFTGNKQENKRLFVETARAFTKAGYAALRFDFYGSGDSAGEFCDSTISHNRANLVDAMKFVRDKGFSKMVVLGISMGAATAILTLNQHPTDAAILWSTVPDTQQLFHSTIPGYESQLSSLEEIEYNGWLIKKSFWLDARNYNIQNSFKNLSMPKFIVQGTGDEPLFTEGFKALQKLAMPPADFYEIPGAGHTYQTVKHRRQIIRATLTWLKRNVSTG